jgi:hypothetical protein
MQAQNVSKLPGSGKGHALATGEAAAFLVRAATGAQKRPQSARNQGSTASQVHSRPQSAQAAGASLGMSSARANGSTGPNTLVRQEWDSSQRNKHLVQPLAPVPCSPQDKVDLQRRLQGSNWHTSQAEKAGSLKREVRGLTQHLQLQKSTMEFWHRKDDMLPIFDRTQARLTPGHASQRVPDFTGGLSAEPSALERLPSAVSVRVH